MAVSSNEIEHDMNNNKIISLATGTVATDAVRLDQIYALSGDTYAWTCTGDNFHPVHPDDTRIFYSTAGEVHPQVDAVQFVAQVYLPHGAVVTAVICYGDAPAEAETWTLKRITLSGGASVDMASANFNSSDTSINNATIDNNSYGYAFATTTLDTGDSIYGAKIIYQLP